MIQKIYEYVLYHSIYNINLFNFLTSTFPKMNKIYIDRLESRANKVYIPQEKLEEMTHNVWQGLCDNIAELDRNAF